MSDVVKSPSDRRDYVWTEIFRTFQCALDPRKLLVAAAGILVMSLGWSFLAMLFHYDVPKVESKAYSIEAGKKSLGPKFPDGTETKESDWKLEATRLYQRDLAEWKVMERLTGPGGKMSALPWNEYRGPNPYHAMAQFVGGSSVERGSTLSDMWNGTIPVLIEPLRKMLIPIIGLFDPHATFTTRVYLLLSFVWCVATWAFFGGIITRIAAVQFAGKDRITLKQAVNFVVERYTSYLLSPLVPLAIVGVIVVCMALYGLLAMIPIIGDQILYGIGMPLVLFGGIVLAILLIGMIGYPLMCTTLSAEGSDTFDALSRSYNYVFQAPWSFAWYWIVSIFYGLAVVLFVVFMGSFSVYMGKWAVSQAPFSESAGRKPDFLFTQAPESFGWRKLLLDGGPLELTEELDKDSFERTGERRVIYVDKNKEVAEAYRKNVWGYERLGAWMTSIWLSIFFLLVIGFSYSYFWTVSTMIYLLMRKKVDETEMDDVFMEDESFGAPITPPAAPASTGVSLPMTTESAPAPAPAPVSAPAPAAPAADESAKPTQE